MNEQTQPKVKFEQACFKCGSHYCLMDCDDSDVVVNLAPRQWVGLTDEEHVKLAEDWGCLGSEWVLFAAAVERAVKEKNT
jgi:hypothetical protein